MLRKSTARIGISVLLCAIRLVSQTAPSSAEPWDEPTTHVSRGVSSPEDASISADGQIVLITSAYDNRLRILDRTTGVVSAPPLPPLTQAILTPDGKALILKSDTDLAGTGSTRPTNLFRYPLPSGPATNITSDLDATLLPYLGSASTDGRIVVFTLVSIVDRLTFDHSRIAAIDTTTGQLTYLDGSLAGTVWRYGKPTVSADGSWVAYERNNGSTTLQGVVMHRLVRGTELIAVGTGGTTANGFVYEPRISADGRHAIFFSNATNLVTETTTVATRLYLRDFEARTTTLVADSPNIGLWPASVSGDGNRVTYIDEALTDPSDPYQGQQPYVYEKSSGSRRTIAVGLNGAIPASGADLAQISADGRTVIFRSEASNLVLGANGRQWFARGPALTNEPPGPTASSYVPVAPVRLLDTRPRATTIDNTYAGTGIQAANTTLELQITGRANIPANAKAVVLNITATGPTDNGYATIWPCAPAPNTPPNASNLNFTTDQTTPNLVIVPIGTNGRICIQSSAQTHLLADLNGYDIAA
jgi:Tol biopolymer transport system component